MLLEAVGKPILYRLKTGREISLIPGKPIEVPEEAAHRLLNQAVGKVRSIEPTSGSLPTPGDSIEVSGDDRLRLLAQVTNTVCAVQSDLPTAAETPRWNQGPYQPCCWEGADAIIRRGICVLLGITGKGQRAAYWIGVVADDGGFSWVREERLRSIHQYEAQAHEAHTLGCAQCGGRGPFRWICGALLCVTCRVGEAHG